MKKFILNKHKVYLFLVFWPIQILALSAIIFTKPNWLLFFIGWVLFCGLGSAVTLHRVLSHKSIKLKKHLKKPFLLLGTLCIQGNPLWWTTVHTEKHHNYSDRNGDPHSPKEGLLHAYIAWIHNKNLENIISIKHIKNIAKDRFLIFLSRYNNEIIWLTLAIGYLIDIHSTLWLWVIPATLSFHQEAIVNVMCHSKIGYTNYKTNDSSTNIPLLALFTWGQALHNNHHSYPKNYNFAKTKKEFDPCVIFLPFIKEKEI